MIFSHDFLQQLMDHELLVINPKPAAEQIQPVGFDLTLNNVYELNQNRKSIYELDLRNEKEEKELRWTNFRLKYLQPLEYENGHVDLEQRRLYYFDTEQTVNLDKRIRMAAFQRSGLARSFIEVTPMSEEGFKYDLMPDGVLNGTIYSHAFPARLYKGQRIMQGVFYGGRFAIPPSYAVKKGWLKVRDGTAKDKYNVSLLLHLDNEALIPKQSDKILDTKSKTNVDEFFDEISLHNFLLQHPALVLGRTVEEVKFSTRIAGDVYFSYGMRKSSIAPLVDPGYEGHLTTTLVGGGVSSILNGGEPVIQILLLQVQGKITKAYGRIKSSQYQKTKSVKEAVSKGIS